MSCGDHYPLTGTYTPPTSYYHYVVPGSFRPWRCPYAPPVNPCAGCPWNGRAIWSTVSPCQSCGRTDTGSWTITCSTTEENTDA